MPPVDRRVLGSWLAGPRSGAQDQGVVFAPRGTRLGLPETGPGSVAPMGRRILALVVDWFVASGLVLATGGSTSDRWYGWVVLALFAVLSWGALSLTGRTLGHRLLGLHLEDLSDRSFQAGRVLLRQLLVCLAVPALVWDADGRGLHDKLAGTVLVRD